MTARYLIGDVFDRLAEIEDGSVDLVITSPPFLALRSYLPADHPLKSKEIGNEATPAAFIDVLLAVTAELRRVLAPHGSIAIELGDTYAASGGVDGNDHGNDHGDKIDQPKFRQGTPRWDGRPEGQIRTTTSDPVSYPSRARAGWPLAKSKTLIPELFRIALAYGTNPFTGQPSPAGQWRIRNVVTWARPNPPVGALGDKWRPATSDVVVACTSPKRYWDDLATRKEHKYGDYAPKMGANRDNETRLDGGDHGKIGSPMYPNPSGAPLLDYWEIPPTGYSGSHYAVYPPALVEPLVKAMCPEKVCRTCGEPSRRIVDYERTTTGGDTDYDIATGRTGGNARMKSSHGGTAVHIKREDAGWSDCGHDNWRPGLILDPFAGSGTTLLVTTGHGHDAVGIDLDSRNAELALERVGPFLLEVEA